MTQLGTLLWTFIRIFGTVNFDPSSNMGRSIATSKYLHPKGPWWANFDQLGQLDRSLTSGPAGHSVASIKRGNVSRTNKDLSEFATDDCFATCHTCNLHKPSHSWTMEITSMLWRVCSPGERNLSRAGDATPYCACRPFASSAW